MKFDTKIALVLREDLPTWQKLNMTAFMSSGIAATVEEVVGENYEDGSGNVYLPMFKQPVMIFAASAEQLKTVYRRAMDRELAFSIFTEELFSTGHDADNRAAVKAVKAEDLNIVGMGFRAEKGSVDKVLKGLALHK